MVSGSLLFMGALLGLRHALEPDHMAALSTIVVRERGARQTVFLGAIWGVGHTLALLAVASVLALAGASLPDRVASAFELGVAVMLVLLGTTSIIQAARLGRRGPLGPHDHGDVTHAHAQPPGGHLHVGRWTFARRSLFVGLVHGLAGSGALTTLVASELPNPFARLVYISIFGLGSVLGMAALSGIAGWPLARLGRRPDIGRALRLTTGVFAVGLGIVWGLPLVDALGSG